MLKERVETVLGIFVLVKFVFVPSRIRLILLLRMLSFHRILQFIKLSRLIALEQKLLEQNRTGRESFLPGRGRRNHSEGVLLGKFFIEGLFVGEGVVKLHLIIIVLISLK